MNIRLKLFATLQRFHGGGLAGTPFHVDLAEGAALAVLVSVLGLPDDEVKICFVNGLIRDSQYVLSDNDDVGIFPPVGGG